MRESRRRAYRRALLAMCTIAGALAGCDPAAPEPAAETAADPAVNEPFWRTYPRAGIGALGAAADAGTARADAGAARVDAGFGASSLPSAADGREAAAS